MPFILTLSTFHQFKITAIDILHFTRFCDFDVINVKLRGMSDRCLAMRNVPPPSPTAHTSLPPILLIGYTSNSYNYNDFSIFTVFKAVFVLYKDFSIFTVIQNVFIFVSIPMHFL